MNSFYVLIVFFLLSAACACAADNASLIARLERLEAAASSRDSFGIVDVTSDKTIEKTLEEFIEKTETRHHQMSAFMEKTEKRLGAIEQVLSQMQQSSQTQQQQQQPSMDPTKDLNTDLKDLSAAVANVDRSADELKPIVIDIMKHMIKDQTTSQTLLIESNLLASIIDLLFWFPADETLVASSLSIIEILSIDEKGREALEVANASRVFLHVSSIEGYKSHEKIMRTLYSFAGNAVIRPKINALYANKDVFEIILASLSTVRDLPEKNLVSNAWYAETIRLLRNLTYGNLVAREILVEMGGLDIVMEAFEKNSSKEALEIAKQCVGFFLNLGLDSERIVGIMASRGVIGSMITRLTSPDSILSSNATDADAIALIDLIYDAILIVTIQQSGRTYFSNNADVLSNLATHLSSVSGNPDYLRAAFGAIGNIGTDDVARGALVQTKIVERIVSLLAEKSGTSSSIEAACGALRNLVVNDKAKTVALTLKVPEILLRILKGSKVDRKVSANAMSVLINLATQNSDNKALLRKYGAVAIIKKIAKKSEGDLKETAMYLLHELGVKTL